MCNIINIACRLLSNTLTDIYHNIRLNCCYSTILFDVVYIDGVCDVEDHLQLERFYLCNKNHTITELKKYISGNFNEVMAIYKNKVLVINIVDNVISLGNTKHRIILGDISLDSYEFN